MVLTVPMLLDTSRGTSPLLPSFSLSFSLFVASPDEVKNKQDVFYRVRADTGGDSKSSSGSRANQKCLLARMAFDLRYDFFRPSFSLPYEEFNYCSRHSKFLAISIALYP